MQDSEFKERRAFLRFTVPITVNFVDSNFKETFYAETKDISVEGMGVVTDKALAPGSNLDICLHMVDNNEKIYVKGNIIWSNMIRPGYYRAGIKIDDPKLKPIPLVLRTIKLQRKY